MRRSCRDRARRGRRLAKTDAVDAVASARALLAEPTLGPVQALEAYDPAVAASAVSNAASTSCSTPTAPPRETNQASAPSQQPPCCARLATRTGSAANPEFARWCGTGAVALSSGDRSGDPIKHRLDSTGNRRVNSVLHIASAAQARQQPDADAYPARKATQGKTPREARRARKRRLANRVIRRMRRDENTRTPALPAAHRRNT